MINLRSNILSQRVQLNLSANTKELSRASERLASGQRINKASDDAAGLAISTGLDTDRILTQAAKRNVSDGISVVSIISSGLSAQKDILFRMAELAELSSNGIYSSKQRNALQSEYSALMEEFDRVATTSTFNGINLLRNPTATTMQFMAGITGVDTSLLQVAAANSHKFAGVLAQRSDWNDNDTVNVLDNTAESLYYATFAQADTSLITENARAFEPAIISGKTANSQNVTAAVMLSNVVGSYTGLSFTITDPPASRAYKATARLESTGETATASGAYTEGASSIALTFNFVTAGTTSSMTMDISGLTHQSRDPVGIDLRTINGDAETRQSAIGFTNVLTRNTSLRALDTVKNRIQDLSTLEGQFGAIEARLNIAHNLLSVGGENFAAAASQIRDADIAQEAATTLRASIMQQISASLLGQANQAPRIALSLLNNK